MRWRGWRGWNRSSGVGEASELLAAAGGVFDRSLDPRQTMRAIADIAVPRLAQLCVIDLLREDGTVGETVMVAEQEKEPGKLEALRAEYPLDLEGEHPVARAIRSRVPVVTDDLRDALALEQIAPEHEVRELIASSGYRSAIVVPLISRGRQLGALSFFYKREARRDDAEHMTLMCDLADRAATALDNATMYAARTHMARTLQHSLLPETLPVLEKVDVSSAYHPVGEGNQVGGDFYDVFTTPLGCWLVVGDVCGKGPEAAAVTALVRHSIRAFAFVRSSPAQVLGAVNEVMLGHSLAQRFATVVVVRLDLTRERARAVVAGAGHPPPVVLARDGSSHCPKMHGMMLGVRSGSNVLDFELELEPGSTIVLYTDGLLDAGAPQKGLTSRELCGVLADHAGSGPHAIVRQLERLALASGAGRLRDDVAIVAARVDS
ncbi:MAG TPA: GAF domain-containing SpoIIE family protein phosphatase [Solirubrobacteraceae bacterium]|nr:GAF domain-containing SpoIIE family protein phosphatase [Solirubrobacteraceae bacterium]